MARFSLGGDEDGEGEGSRNPRPKRPRVAPPRPPQSSSSIAIVQSPPQPPQTVAEAEETEEEESESGSDVEEEDTESDEEQSQQESESESEGEDILMLSGRRVSGAARSTSRTLHTVAPPKLTAQPNPQVGPASVSRVALPTSRTVLLHQVAPPNPTAQPNPQVGPSLASLAPPSNVAVQAEGPRSISPAADGGSVVFTLSDPDVLDCLICYEPLTIPVFQCDNGHIACSSCCTKIRNKCPSCSFPIGYNRCRAIEKVLESIRVSCQNIKHGCKEMLTYLKKTEHEKACMYAPCSCPHSGCNFVSSSKQLYKHFSSNHVNSATSFVFNCSFSLTLNISDKFHVLQEENCGILFILDNKDEILGNLVSISCIQPCLRGGGGFHYDVLAKSRGSSLKFQSFTKSTPGRVNRPASTGYFIIPCGFVDGGRLKMDICIWRAGHCPAPLQIFAAA